MLATNAGLLTPILGDPSPWTPQRLYLNGEAGVFYDPGDLTAEKVAWRRNLLTWSEDFTNSVWTKSAATITANTATAPDGTTTADTLTDNATTDFHGVYQARTYAGPFTASLYVKYVNKQYVSFVTNNNGTGDRYAYFDLVNKTVHSVNAGFTASIIDVGGGWLRLTVSGQSFTLVSAYYWWSIALNTTTTPYLGDGTGQVQVWGGMVNPSGTVESYQRITDFTSDFLAAFPTHALYQDAAGTTPVTALGQPVGLALDKSRGGLANVGPEIITNGDFSGGTTGWTAANSATLSVVGGQLSVVNGATALGQARQSYTTVVGRMYRLSVEFVSVAASRGSVFVGTFAGDNSLFSSSPMTSSRLVTGFFTATGTTTHIALGNADNTAALEVRFDNVSVREVPGVHAIQPTSASRPALDARVNLLTYSEQFDNAAWTKTAVTVTANNAAAPDGATMADLITPAASTAYHAVNQNIAMVVGTAYTVLAYFKQTVGGARYGYLLIGGNNKTGVFDTQTGTVTFTSAGISSASMLSVGNGWYLCVMTLTAASGDSNVFMGPTTSATTGNAATAATDTILLWGADVRLATDAAYPYQRVVTATDYADVGVPRSFLHDGFDDSSYTASSLDLSGTDKVTVWAGVYKNSDAARGMVLELSSTVANAGALNLEAPVSNTPTFAFGWNGTPATPGAWYGPTGYAAPISRVLSVAYDLSQATKSTQATPRINGVLDQTGGSASGASGGTFANAVLNMGRRNNASIPFNGKIYTIIIRGGVTDAATLALTERYVGSRMGIVL